MRNKSYLIDVLDNRQHFLVFLLFSGWLFSELFFWSWWIRPEHITSPFGFLINSGLLLWNSIMLFYFFFFILRMKKPNPALDIPHDWRIAMVVTKAPSEPFSVVKKTIQAMINQPIPHHNWLADEDPTEEVISWCKAHNVFISTRKNVAEYHRDSWPRRTKCKEGNLAYFYDHYGYKHYDFVVQLDADHIPQKGYLKAMLQPFVDPHVGYVSAPSICSSNASESWIARARLYAEATLHGPVQAGHSNGFAPLCFGSHYAVRTKALKSIGGIGPELAEDHSTTLMMNVHGWNGVHAIDAIAIGDGPHSFSDAMIQEFQWSRSLFILLISLTPRYFKVLPLKLKFQFLFAQLWYPFFVIFMISGLLIPSMALIFGSPLVSVGYFTYLLYSIMPMFFALLFNWIIRSLGLFRPIDAPLISWEVILYQIARWPWVFWAIIMAVITVIRKKYIEFRVTPKGQIRSQQIELSILTPYIFVMSVMLIVLYLVSDNSNVYGYFYFLLINIAMYFSLIITALIKHKKEAISKK